MDAEPIQFANLDAFLWGVVATIQYYSLPIMAISLALLGVAMVMSGDDIDRKSKIKGVMINICIGGLIVFGAATLANLIKGFVGGA